MTSGELYHEIMAQVNSWWSEERKECNILMSVRKFEQAATAAERERCAEIALSVPCEDAKNVLIAQKIRGLL